MTPGNGRLVQVMGVVNVTDDSFSDGGRYLDPARAIDHAMALVAEGADIIDVGGESTRPGAVRVDASVETARIVPVVKELAAQGVTVSIDTMHAAVARAALESGARIVNDVSGGRFDPGMGAAVAATDATYIAGHLRGRSLAEVFASEAPASWREVAAELDAALAALPGELRGRTWVDPGVGFGKGADPEGNLDLLRHAGDLGRALGCPVVVGPSRKRFLKTLLGGAEPDLLDLDAASVAACLAAARAGARVLRVHNVALLRPALTVYTKL